MNRSRITESPLQRAVNLDGLQEIADCDKTTYYTDLLINISRLYFKKIFCNLVFIATKSVIDRLYRF